MSLVPLQIVFYGSIDVITRRSLTEGLRKSRQLSDCTDKYTQLSTAVVIFALLVERTCGCILLALKIPVFDLYDASSTLTSTKL